MLLAGAVGAGLVVLAARQAWAHAIFTPPRPLPAQDIAVTGQQLVPLASALALAALACLAAVIATRSVLRRAVGVLLAVLGAATAAAVLVSLRASAVLAAARASALSGPLGGSTTSGSPSGGAVHEIVVAGPGRAIMAGAPWRAAAIAGAVAIVLAGAATAWRGPRWPVMSARFERPGGPGGSPSRTSRACGSRSAATSTRRSTTPTRRSMTAPGRKPGSRSVLLAEHEPEVAEMSARYLRRDGLRVRLVTTPEQALAELTAGPDAAAVLDLTMPGLDPRRIRRALRTPVIFLVAGLQGPRPRGLARGGASGPRRWLARPFGPRQLVAMVRDVLAIPVPPPAGDAGELKLTATETAVLTALLGQQGRVLSRRQLLTAAGRPAAGDRAVDVVIAQLRAKIGGAGTIRTVRGAGYVIDPGTNPDTGAISGGQSPGRRSGRATISGATVPI